MQAHLDEQEEVGQDALPLQCLGLRGAAWVAVQQPPLLLRVGLRQPLPYHLHHQAAKCRKDGKKTGL
jgi:hypothetical protein